LPTKQFANPRTKLPEHPHHTRSRPCALHRLSQTRGSPSLYRLALLPHHLEQWLQELRHGRIPRLSSTRSSQRPEVHRRKLARGVTAGVTDGGVGRRVLEPLGEVSEHLVEVRSRRLRVGGAERGEEAEQLAPGRGGEPLGVGGQRVEKHGHRVRRRRRADDAVEVLDGDVVGIAVGELGERGEHPRLELRHRRVLRRRGTGDSGRRGPAPAGGGGVRRRRGQRGGGRPRVGLGPGFEHRGRHCSGSQRWNLENAAEVRQILVGAGFGRRFGAFGRGFEEDLVGFRSVFGSIGGFRFLFLGLIWKWRVRSRLGSGDGRGRRRVGEEGVKIL
jgi:hypothetical protein